VQAADRFVTPGPSQEPPSYRACQVVSWRRKGNPGVAQAGHNNIFRTAAM